MDLWMCVFIGISRVFLLHMCIADGVPIEYDEPEFVWEEYLEETGSSAVPPTAFKHVSHSILYIHWCILRSQQFNLFVAYWFEVGSHKFISKFCHHICYVFVTSPCAQYMQTIMQQLKIVLCI